MVDYQLDLESGATHLTANLTVRIGGALKIARFTTPGYVRTGLPYLVSWATTGVTYLELRVDGALVYVAPDLATAAGGSTLLPAISTNTAQVQVLVRNNRGGELTELRSVELVGRTAFVSFTADKTSIAQGGEAVQLSWSVTNARNVRIVQTGVGAVHASSGHVDTGSATIYPNRASSVFRLVADNGAGDTVSSPPLTVTVGAPGGLTFESLLPVGATAKATGHTVLGGAEVYGLPQVVKNAPGEAFIDISVSGQPAVHTEDYTAGLSPLGETFDTRIFGRRVSADSISISPDGWFFFSPTLFTGPLFPTTAFGTETRPLALVPFYGDLYATAGVSEIYQRLDTVNGERRLIVQWTNMSKFDTRPGANPPAISHFTFQVQITSGGKVVFAYQTVDFGSDTLTPAAGVVSAAQTETLATTTAPQTGDTFTFFGLAQLPANLKVEAVPYAARVAVGAAFVDIDADARLLPGQLAITELNPRPAAGVTNGEWVELTNFSALPINLKGWTLSSGSATHAITTDVMLAPNSVSVLAQAADLGDPTAGLNATYVYPATFAMADTSGTFSLMYGTATYESVSWDATSQTGAGISVRADRLKSNVLYASTPACLPERPPARRDVRDRYARSDAG
ncbi:MAG: lamin tail domain-containing protein [Archangiaceae bacterium]|nr:lamin tail domain-containing protein [Archangiaceae bacterium]